MQHICSEFNKIKKEKICIYTYTQQWQGTKNNRANMVP